LLPFPDQVTAPLQQPNGAQRLRESGRLAIKNGKTMANGVPAL
jgi:hypothetical protein